VTPFPEKRIADSSFPVMSRPLREVGDVMSSASVWSVSDFIFLFPDRRLRVRIEEDFDDG
jgi:hypothetical protein